MHTMAMAMITNRPEMAIERIIDIRRIIQSPLVILMPLKSIILLLDHENKYVMGQDTARTLSDLENHLERDIGVRLFIDRYSGNVYPNRTEHIAHLRNEWLDRHIESCRSEGIDSIWWADDDVKITDAGKFVATLYAACVVLNEVPSLGAVAVTYHQGTQHAAMGCMITTTEIMRKYRRDGGFKVNGCECQALSDWMSSNGMTILKVPGGWLIQHISTKDHVRL